MQESSLWASVEKNFDSSVVRMLAPLWDKFLVEFRPNAGGYPMVVNVNYRFVGVGVGRNGLFPYAKPAWNIHRGCGEQMMGAGEGIDSSDSRWG